MKTGERMQADQEDHGCACAFDLILVVDMVLVEQG